MNNTDMETFWAVLEHGTLTAAAEALFITQPTLTNRIQSLEAEVGAQLFHRGKGIRHIELTEAGQRFLPLAAARTLAQAGRARICHLTDPAPDRVSYLMTRRGEALSEAAQLLLEDIRTEIQRIEGVHMVQ